MCDKIKENDEKISTNFIKNDPCIQVENKNLEKCLKDNNNSFIKCKEYVEKLKICYNNKKNINNNNP